MTNITKIVYIAMIYKILFLYCDNNYISNVMNNKVVININNIIKYDFKHLFTYKLFYHIIAYCNPDNYTIDIIKNNISKMYNVSIYSVDNAINELIDNNIISKYNYYRYIYRINNKKYII